MNLNLNKAQVDLLWEDVIPNHVDEKARDVAKMELSTSSQVGGTLAVEFGNLRPEIKRAIEEYLSTPGLDSSKQEAASGILRQLRDRRLEA